MNMTEARIIAYNQALQDIETLKNALIKERSLSLAWLDDPANLGKDCGELFKIMALKMLISEYPDIFRGD